MSYAIIIPVRNEEACMGAVIDELQGELPDLDLTIAVGLNGTSDRSGIICRERDAVVGETPQVGYGHGCLAAIDALNTAGILPAAYIFVSGDGSNAPSDIRRLIQTAEETGAPMVIGQRTLRLENWGFGIFGPRRALPNVTLGLWTSLLSGRPFCDIGPLRLIDRRLFERLNLREVVWGWTIEAQILACRLKVPVRTISVVERPRLAGEQKVSAVSWKRSLEIGLHIAAAGMRARLRTL
jgi:Glycosyl transferase family 2